MSQLPHEPGTDALALTAYLTRHARLVAWGAIAVLIATRCLLQFAPDRYESRASFAPSGPSAADLSALGGLGGMAASLGLVTGGQQGAKFYADLVQSDAVLIRALDTLRRGIGTDVPPTDYAAANQLDAPSPLHLRDATLHHLRESLSVQFDARTSVVTLSVEARDPAMAHAVAKALVAALDRFNIDLLQRTASARTQFLEERIVNARSVRAESEARLRGFLQGNRLFQTSPGLALRESDLRQDFEAKNATLRSLEEALEKSRIEQSRDTPVLLMLDTPLLPVTPTGPRRMLLALELAFLWVFGCCLVLTARAVVQQVAAERPDDLRRIRSDLAGVTRLPTIGSSRSRGPAA